MTTVTHHRVPVSLCLSCGAKQDGATGFKGPHKPSPGDMSICLYCGHLMAYGDKLILRELTDAEVIEVAGHPALVKAQKIRAEYLRFKDKKP